MIEWIAKHIIPEYQEYQNPQVRQKYGMLCGMVGIFLNLLLFAGKLAAGFFSHSIAIVADAFNNLSDAGSSLILLFGFRLSGQKPDPEHPFGHGRLEYISGLIVSIIIILMAVELMKTSADKIMHPEMVEFRPVTLVVLLGSIAVKLYMYYYNKTISRRIHSAAMEATALDSVSDAAATGAVLAATVISCYAGWQTDGVCGLLVALFVLYAGIRAAKDTIDPLLGQPAEECFVQKVRDMVLEREEILGMHDLVVHNYGPGRIMLTLHAEVPVDGSLAALHEVIDEVEHRLSDELGCEAVIHMDPIWAKDEETQAMRQRMTAFLQQIDETLSLHDFRMVRCTGHTRVFFDIQEPFACPIDENQLIERLREDVRREDPDMELIVRVDRV